MQVLVGVEDTDGARVALRWAAELVERSGGSLVVAQAWQYPAFPLLADADRVAPAEEVDAQVEQALADMVAATLEGEAASVDVTYRAVRGSAPHAVRNAAASLGVDLVVVGARGQSPLDRRLVGSVSRSLAEDAPCSVAVVPADLGNTAGPIVVGVDGSEDAVAALEWAADAAAASQTEVVMVHGFGPYGAELPPDALADDKSQGEHLVAGYSELLDARGVPYRSVVRVQDARSLLEHVGETEQARMVVVGARGTGRLTSMLLGSVSSYLVSNLHRPTVVVHRD